MSIHKRIKAPTPKFFKIVRNIGLVLGSVGGVLLTAPLSLPTLVTTVAGYMAVAGGAISSVSQLTKDEKKLSAGVDQ
ncbi:hypothetical protein [Mesonia aestuariivivens]|uniref:Holin n=1 Tax=Mesonia aestuariivivens TaxID=2796128 RepID=A0ABS6W571_9FLAO|nr:hypothetical protein [Mesonia aestuariivivens]MBW2963000.1 hypothetical protein [Mesonia aestuariivivens]